MFNGGDDENTLDLSNFSQVLEPKDIIFSLSNKRCFNLLCDQINGIYKLKDSFRIFKFANNGICSLEPISKLHGFKIDVLDLSNNSIPLQDLHSLKIFGIKIRDVLPSLTVIDGDQPNANSTAMLVEIRKAPAKPKFRNGNGAGNYYSNQYSLEQIRN